MTSQKKENMFMHVLADIKYAFFAACGAVDRFKGYGRNVPASVGLSVHCEKIYDARIYFTLLQFSKYYNRKTGKKLIVCVHTPKNPVTDYVMRTADFKETEYQKRLESLRPYCALGYHGHFYRKRREGEYALINTNSPHPQEVRDQIREEFRWFKNHDFYPRLYIAGWWYLSKEIITQLESEGIEADFSLHSSGKDSFGHCYLGKAGRPPLGRPFILPPSKRIVAIQTVFGPTSHSYRIGKLLAPYMGYKKDKEIYFVFAIHDWDLLTYYREIRRSVELITDDPGDFAWSEFDAPFIATVRERIQKEWRSFF